MGIRWQHIRSAAAALRTAYAAETGLATVPLLLPLDDVADRVHLLTVCEDQDLDPRVNGELNPQIGSIRLRPGMTMLRRRFVIAHELGHYVLEGGALVLYEDDDATIDERAGGDINNDPSTVSAYNIRERREKEANLFALELLIPAEALSEAVQQPDWTVGHLAAQFGVSPDALRTQLVNVCCLEPVIVQLDRSAAIGASFSADKYQQRAVEAPMPTLVVAGPGTGKTRTIVAKYLALVAQGIDPAHILALTFSNKAAEEMRERIVAALNATYPDQSGRVDVSTFHAWGLNFLKLYGHQIGLPLDVQLRSSADIYVLLRRRLSDLPLDQYKDLRDPGMYLRQIISALSHAKDELCDPTDYGVLAESEALRLIADTEQQNAGKTTIKAQEAREKAARDAARLRELAAIYARYDQILREEKALDYGDLIMRSVEVLRIPLVVAAAQQQHQYILVDEFQDINYASGELVRLLDGGRGRVWAVGDPWQSIYRFRGASPVHLQQFTNIYPNAETHALNLNYRSLQPILDASHALMAPDTLASLRAPLDAWRVADRRHRIVEWIAGDASGEAATIAHDILRRVLRSSRRWPRCTRSPHKQLRRTTRRPYAAPRRWRFADHAVLCRTHAQSNRVAATLQAHGIPVDHVGELFDAPEVKDVLAVCAMVRSNNSIGMLRALTVPEHALDADDMATLVRLAHHHKVALPRAARDETIVSQLSPMGQRRLQDLHALVDNLGAYDDAWQVLTHYLFEHSIVMREYIAAAAYGSFPARRALAMFGQLITLARAFIQQVPPHERAPAYFITYIRLLIEAGESIKVVVPIDHADVVQVMTVHAAKGLEFPIVYVPGVQEGIFPPRKQYGSIPALPTMTHGGLGDELQEERYLLYVAMTRARDRLVLSRVAAKGEKAIKRSPLLPGGAEGADAPWPVRVSVTSGQCPKQTFIPRLSAPPITRSPIPASSIETYERCPRQYLYQYGFQLYDDLSPYLRMHQTIRDVVQDLAQHTQLGTLPSDEATLRDLTWQVFASHEMANVLYRDDYFAEVLRHVTQVWRDFGMGTYTPDDVNRYFIVQRPTGRVSVRVDRIESGKAGPRLIRTRTGREREKDHLSMPIMLYALASQQAYDNASEVMLHYTATGTYRPATPTAKVLNNHTADIDRLLEGIENGQWEPNPGIQCANCPFNLICPV